MASVNKVIIVGNAGRDPDMRYAPDGTAFCNVTVATTDTWKDRQTGEKKEATEWHKVVFSGKLAEIAGQYLKKGRPVYIEGSLRTRKWTNKEGVDQYTTEIRADQMQMLGSKDGGEDRQESRQEPRRQPARSEPAAQSGGGFADFDSDIPFSFVGRGISIHSI